MRRRHAMPFGAEVLETGEVRFRLWAPAACGVSLCLERASGTDILPMAALPGGWFECVTALAGPGSRYRYQLESGMRVPDPASRFNPGDVHGASEVIAPRAFEWKDDGWRGRPWEEAVIYELHVGAFSPEGTFAGVERRLGYLAELGVTALELMPVADFPGARNWGYDGVLPYAPDHRYGRPEALKSLVQSAHAHGLMVLLDVVYNHFGPEGNYLHLYAPQFFTERHRTPWGAALDFDGAASRTVRDFFIHNALYWLEEYHLDGLRLDAVHSILDDTRPDILLELATAVRQGPGRGRHVHLVLENERNEAGYLAGPELFDAQWNDDLHHALHVLLTGERDGYYADYADDPVRHLLRCLTQGFAYQGEPSGYRHGAARGTPCAHLPPQRFVAMLQNHDQIGNRAFGERLPRLADLRAVRAAVTLLLLAPFPPLLFMGEERGAGTPFLFFCDFGPDLAGAVTAGRRREFARFERFADPAARARLPDPNALDSYEASRLDWGEPEAAGGGEWFGLYKRLLATRRAAIVPRLAGMRAGNARARRIDGRAIEVRWEMGDGSRLALLSNLGATAIPCAAPPPGELLFASDGELAARLDGGMLPQWSTAWYLERPAAR